MIRRPNQPPDAISKAPHAPGHPQSRHLLGGQTSFVLLILSFAVWGIGDIFRQPGAEATVITVGSEKVTGVEVVNQIRRDVEQLRPMFGGQLDMAQAREMGIVDRSIEQLVQRKLYAHAAADLGILVGDDAVRRALAANPQFRSAGQFDPAPSRLCCSRRARPSRPMSHPCARTSPASP